MFFHSDLSPKNLVGDLFAPDLSPKNLVDGLFAPRTYELSVTYDTLTTIGPPTEEDPNVLRANITGEVAEGEVAPFGLTNFESNTFGTLTEVTTSEDGTIETATFEFNADPTEFGLPADLQEQPYSDRYYGEETDNELFGTADDMATLNFVEGTIAGSGEITIIDGNGLFEDATGLITFEQQDELPPIEDPTNPFASLTEPAPGQATLTFTIETPSLWDLLSNEAFPIGDHMAFGW